MKKITSPKIFRVFFLSMVLCMVTTVSSQIPKEAFDLTNSLSDLWHKGETEKAVQSSVRLYELYPAFLVDRIHNSLSQSINDNAHRQNGMAYLEAIMKQNNPKINELVLPIYTWGKLYQTDDIEEIKDNLVVLKDCFTDSSFFKSRPERYCLLALKVLEQKAGIDENLKLDLLMAVMSQLEKYSFLQAVVTDRKLTEERAWNRYLLAYSNYYMFSNFDKNAMFIQRASEYSPDKYDILRKYAYSYDAFLLTGRPTRYSFQKDYFKYLHDNKNFSKALNLLTEITFGEPSDNNLNGLQHYYSEQKLEKPFKTYWTDYINTQSSKVPDITINFPGEKLDLKKKPGCWIYIDIWGTWCSPCKKELPDLQELYVKNSENKQSNLKIYTFSYASQNLEEFMKENKYVFPVSEVDNHVTQLFNVTGYPTKILITPEGNYLTIPFNSDWRTYIKNYALM
ncbi:TlpA family protein disulfide reductase [Saccharicrinis sp. FJH54]|uniref:TlpA family protein disulfide reductase n=1 Tax=Saccharicrinis sp. FJH54 TaxID=3344665 RepID=UPI0035D50518